MHVLRNLKNRRHAMSEEIMKKSIVKQLMIQMFFVLIIPVLLVGFFYDYSYRKALYRDAKQKLQEYVECCSAN